VRHRLALEQPPAGQHLVEHDTERPDIGAAIDRAAGGLLRRHVRRGAEDHPHLRRAERQRRRLRELRGRPAARRHPHRIHRLRQSEVEDFDFPFNGSFDVLWFEISVDDALLVRFFERVSNLQRDGKAFIEG
jgi:hypothetical protein